MHTLVIKDNNPVIFAELLSAASQSEHASGIPLIIGLDSNDPLNVVLKPIRKHTLSSEHFLTTYADVPPAILNMEFPYSYPEVARL